MAARAPSLGPTPAWAYAILAFLVLAALDAVRPIPVPAEATRWAADLREPPDPRTMSPRALRCLPAIGETLALAVARARWLHRSGEGPLRWSDVRGIGPATEARVVSWLRERRVPRPRRVADAAHGCRGSPARAVPNAPDR